MPKRSNDVEIEEDVRFDDEGSEEEDDSVKEFNLADDEEDELGVEEAGEEGFFNDE